MKNEKCLTVGIILTLLSIMFVSCLDNDDHYNDDIVRFVYEPVVIKATDPKTTIKTQYGDILAPQMDGKAKTGEYYFVNFWMDKSVQPYTAFNIQGKRMGVDTVSIITDKIDDDYSLPISDVKIYLQDPNVNFLRDKNNEEPVQTFICIDSTFFIAPQMSVYDSHNQAYEYELLAPADSIENGIPILYLRAKESVENYAKSAYALNLSALIKQPQYAGKKEIKFNLKFKSGETSGEDVYSGYKNNPITLKYSK